MYALLEKRFGLPPPPAPLPIVPLPAVAIVTGAGRGIGRVVSIRLAQLGYRVALVARTEADLLEVEQVGSTAVKYAMPCRRPSPHVPVHVPAYPMAPLALSSSQHTHNYVLVYLLDSWLCLRSLIEVHLHLHLHTHTSAPYRRPQCQE